MRSGFFLQKTAYPFFLQKNLAVCVAWITFAMQLYRNRGSAPYFSAAPHVMGCFFVPKNRGGVQARFCSKKCHAVTFLHLRIHRNLFRPLLPSFSKNL